MMGVALLNISGVVRGIPSGKIYYLMTQICVVDQKGNLAFWFLAYDKEGEVHKLQRGEFKVI